MIKLNNILLVDDNPGDNFYHSIILEDVNCTENITHFEKGKEALEFISEDGEPIPKADLIFLDINMPTMSGWEFLEHYEKIEDHKKAQSIVVMLTTSSNPDDRKKAEKFKSVSDFLVKPLTEEACFEIINKHFSKQKSPD